MKSVLYFSPVMSGIVFAKKRGVFPQKTYHRGKDFYPLILQNFYGFAEKALSNFR